MFPIYVSVPDREQQAAGGGGRGDRNGSEVWLSTECAAISHSGGMLLLEDFNVTRLTATDDLLSLRSLIKTGMQSMLGDKEAHSILHCSRRDSGT